MPSVIIQIIILLITIFFIAYYLYTAITEYKNSKVILQSELIKLSPDIKYTFIYKHNFLNIRTMTIQPDKNHVTLLNKSTLYSGKIDVHIQVNNSGLLIYSAYLKNVLKIEENLAS